MNIPRAWIAALTIGCAGIACSSSSGGNGDGGGGATPFDPAPERVTFGILSSTGGPSFAIGSDAYTIIGSQIQRYDGNGFTQVADAGVGTIDCIESYCVTVANGKAYILGGLQNGGQGNCLAWGTSATNRAWEYDPSAQTVTEIASMNEPREVHACGSVDGKVYALWGWDSGNSNPGTNSTTVEVYENGAWTILSTSGEAHPVRSPAYATIGKKIYLFGGCVSSEEGGFCPCMTQYTQVFDTEANTWSQGETMVLAGRHFSGQHTSVRQDRYVYVFGGSTGFSCMIYKDIGIYDTEANAWQLSSDTMYLERKSCGSVTVGDSLFIFGGLTCPEGGCEGVPTCQSPTNNCNKVGAGESEIGAFASP